MIEGAVNAASQAVVVLSLRGPSGRTLEVEAVVDTGFDRFLTLPPRVVTELDLAFVGLNSVQLADGSEAALDSYAVTVLWDGRPRRVVTYVSDAAPLVGMALLAGHRLCVDVEPGGRVAIESAA
ncbi:MAG: clan AA aspartic protease [Chloroflexota bacterium]|nr:clan AA aspartic protease [Chloroflexota bacterium]